MIVASSSGYDSGEIASITVNDSAPVIEKNENNHLRGLHIVIVNPTSGKVESAKAFDTYKSSDKLDDFLENSEVIQKEGYIVAAVCRDECVSKLSSNAKKWFLGMGSKEI